MPDIYDRISGALLGLAIGDALGAPFENMTHEEILRKCPQGVRDFAEGGNPHYRPGQGTDDTELALLVCYSLMENQGLNMQDIAERLVSWGKRQPNLGPSTGTGLRALEAGVPYREAGNLETPSSGCLPRCAPLALVMPKSCLVPATIECCLPTHRHPLAIAASVTQNILLNRLIGGFQWEQIQSRFDEYPGANQDVDLLPILEALNCEFQAPGAVDVLAEAFRCVAGAASAEGALALAVEMGGDTDTRGAVAGALAGARWGASALPQRWISSCEYCEEISQIVPAFLDLRRKLYA